jgi:sugar lactone lactonase YvrE
LFFGAVGQARSQSIYWTDNGSGQIWRADLNSSGAVVGTTMLVGGLSKPAGLALDTAGGMMYWAESGSGEIRRATLEGNGVTTLESGLLSPSGIALDTADGVIYWTDMGRGNSGDIRRAPLAGGLPKTLLTGKAFFVPFGIALDLAGGVMYWSNISRGQILQTNLNGSGTQTLVSGLVAPGQIALDFANSKMYWANEYGNIGSATLPNGSNPQILIPNLQGTRPIGIALDLAHSQMYWTANETGVIWRANLDGTGAERVLTGLSAPWGIAVAP